MSKHRTRFGVPIGYIAVLYAALIILPYFLLSDYLAGLLIFAFLYAIVAVSTDVVWGYAGMLTFASAAMFGIGGYSFAIAMNHLALTPWAIAAGVVIGLLVVVALCALMGWLVFYSGVKISEFYITVVTLAIGLSFSQILLYGGSVTGGSNGLSNFGTVHLAVSTWYLLIGTFLFVVILGGLAVMRSDFGTLLRATRDNADRCRYLGVNVPLLQSVVFCAANAVMALAGAAYAMYTSSVTPSMAGILFTTDVLIWVTIGGRATIVGPALAAIVLSVARPYLSTQFPLAWQALLGLLFIVVVIGLPAGLFPVASRALGALRGRSGASGRRAANDGGADAGVEYTIVSAPENRSAQAGDAARGRDATLALKVVGVSKSYGSFNAVGGVDLSIHRGELVSLVGPNGAGKTSLGRCISDGRERTRGEVYIDGRRLGRGNPEIAVKLGLGRKFQAPSVFESLDVGDCLKIASWRGSWPSAWRRSHAIALPPSALRVFDELGLASVLADKAGNISHGQKQALELAMVLSLEPVLLLLDEPTAGLSKSERSKIGDVLGAIHGTGDTAIILIEHDFEFVKRVSSRMVVLAAGRIIADGHVEEVAGSQLVQDVYIGK